MTATRDEIIAEIEAARCLIKYHEERLALHDRYFPEGSTDEAGRFYRVRPRIAFRKILEERGRGMTEEELLQAFVDGDGIRGKKRGIANPREALKALLETRAKNPAFKKVNGLVGLPEWGEDKF